MAALLWGLKSIIRWSRQIYFRTYGKAFTAIDHVRFTCLLVSSVWRTRGGPKEGAGLADMGETRRSVPPVGEFRVVTLKVQ